MNLLARNWWVLALRGVFSILFALVAFLMPGATLQALIIIFGAFALFEGGALIAAGIMGASSQERWWALILEGVLGILAGIVAFASPLFVVLTLVALVAAWAIITGLFEIAVALKLRKEIEGEWLMIAVGALSVLLGFVLMARPGASLVALAYTIGFYALLTGIAEIALAFKLRQRLTV